MARSPRAMLPSTVKRQPRFAAPQSWPARRGSLEQGSTSTSAARDTRSWSGRTARPPANRRCKFTLPKRGESTSSAASEIDTQRNGRAITPRSKLESWSSR